MPIKILFISHRTDIGGGELSLFDLIAYLSKENKIEPYIVSNNRFNQSNNSPLIEFVKEYGIEIA